MALLNDFMEQWQSDSPYIDAHTSGSTGRPKNIRLLKADMRQSAQATNTFFGINNSSILATPLSFDYIAGKMMAVRAIEADCRLVELPVSNEIELSGSLHKIDLLPVVPSQINSLLQHPEYAAGISAVLIGGAAPSTEQCRRLVESGYKAFISYGMTETCSHVALARAEDPLRVFHAMPGITFDTDDDGRLTIIAPKFSFGSIRTNDITELIDSGSFRWRGRADGVINSGGIKLFPEELEALYAPVLRGRPFYVCAAPHIVWGQAAMLVIEGCADIDTISESLSSLISDHRKLPKYIKTIKKLPRTSNGKIRRLLPPD